MWTSNLSYMSFLYGSTAFLIGPQRQVTMMLDPARIYATALYLASIIIALFCALYVSSVFLISIVEVVCSEKINMSFFSVYRFVTSCSPCWLSFLSSLVLFGTQSLITLSLFTLHAVIMQLQYLLIETYDILA